MSKFNDGIVFEVVKGVVMNAALGIINNSTSIVRAGEKIFELVTEDIPTNKGKK